MIQTTRAAASALRASAKLLVWPCILLTVAGALLQKIPLMGRLSLGLLTILALTATPIGDAHAADDDALLEFHFKPVPNLQIAIWIEDADGEFVEDVFITQATGKLGIGNRSGRWDFLSSWRAPYGARPSVLPVWSSRRGKTYPKVVFYDDDASDQNSLGWHENSSSPETYYCRPLTPEEHDTISVDTMTCPSPQAFQTDKGRFAPGQTSRYPPRNDLIEFEENHDSADAKDFADINDLDAYTGATPIGDTPEFLTATVPATALEKGPITAWIEINLENDQNAHWSFDRENDHYVDPKLSSYGIPYLGQPSVVYKVELDARDAGFIGTSNYFGYGDWDGGTGSIHLPDETINVSSGSGADRLLEYTLNNETFRFGVYSYGAGAEPGTTGDDTTGGTSDSDTGTDTTTTGGDDGGGWGQCRPVALSPITDLTAQATAFDTVELSFTVPELSDDPSSNDSLSEVSKVRIYYIPTLDPLTEEMLGAATESSVSADMVVPGERSTIAVEQLWGNYTYQFGVRYEDKCANKSELASTGVKTPAQEFQQVEGFCFLATAAYGASWQSEVSTLRWFRDLVLRSNPMGSELVRFYYTYSPPLADVIEDQPVLRSMVRAVVQPVADVTRLATSR